MLHDFLSRPFKHNQTQSNLFKWFRMQRHDWSSTSQKKPMLHLSLSPYTGYQLQLASSSRHWCLHIEQPQAQHPPNSTHYYESTSPPEVLRSASKWCLMVPSQRGSKSLSKTFSFTVPGWWNDLPTPIRNAGSLSIFKQQLKTSQVTYVTMVPRMGNETLRPLGVATGNASAWLVSEDTYVKTPPVGRRQPMTSLPACHNISAAGRIHHQLLRLKLASEAWSKA